MPDQVPVGLRSVQRLVAHSLERQPANRKIRPVGLAHRLPTSSSRPSMPGSVRALSTGLPTSGTGPPVRQHGPPSGPPPRAARCRSHQRSHAVPPAGPHAPSRTAPFPHNHQMPADRKEHHPVGTKSGRPVTRPSSCVQADLWAICRAGHGLAHSGWPRIPTGSTLGYPVPPGWMTTRRPGGPSPGSVDSGLKEA